MPARVSPKNKSRLRLIRRHWNRVCTSNSTGQRPRNNFDYVSPFHFTRWSAFSCETEVEQHAQRDEDPHNRNSEPPAILPCHERASLPKIASGTAVIAFWFRENCALQHVPSRPARIRPCAGADRPATEPADRRRTSGRPRLAGRPSARQDTRGRGRGPDRR
jgi:hypothetical protein